jgi:Protein of unknown function (DUF1569)
MLIERLSALTGREQPLWGKMTADQMMSHLVQAGELPFNDNVADRSTFVMRTIAKPLILYVLPMPKEVKTAADFNQQEDGRRPTGFTADRDLLIGLIHKLGDLPAGEKCSRHPMFGKMKAKEWAIIAHKHIDHHLTQFGG